LITEMYCYY